MKSGLSQAVTVKLDRFYGKLMRHEDYDGKGMRNDGRASRARMVAPSMPTPSDDGDRGLEVVERSNYYEKREYIEIDSSPEPEQRQVKEESDKETPHEARRSINGTAGKRMRGEAVEFEPDDDEAYLMAQLKAKRAKRELKEAMLEEAEFEQKLAARKKR